MIALMVYGRFSAWSKARCCVEENTSSVTSRPSVMPVRSATSRPPRCGCHWNAGRQCMNRTSGVAGRGEGLGVDLVRRQQLHPLVPDLLPSPIETQTSVMQCRRARELGGVLGERDARAGAAARRRRCAARRRSATAPRARRCGRRRPRSRPSRAASGPCLSGRRRGRACREVGDRAAAAVLEHREEVGEHLRRVPLVGEPVVDRDVGVRRESRRVCAAPGTRSRRTSATARARCRPPTPCARSARRPGRGR